MQQGWYLWATICPSQRGKLLHHALEAYFSAALLFYTQMLQHSELSYILFFINIHSLDSVHKTAVQDIMWQAISERHENEWGLTFSSRNLTHQNRWSTPSFLHCCLSHATFSPRQKKKNCVEKCRLTKHWLSPNLRHTEIGYQCPPFSAVGCAMLHSNGDIKKV